MGSDVIRQIKDIKANVCISGQTGSCPSRLKRFDWEIAQAKKAMIHASKKTVAMCISERLDSNRKSVVATIEHIDHLITELPAGRQLLALYHQAGIGVL